MKKTFLSTERFVLSQSLILPNLPEGINLQQVGETLSKSKNSTEKFGFWDSSNANFHTFYPDLKAEDIKPEEGDYVYPVFRLLSEVIVNKRWNPVDFSKEAVLKNSVSKIIGQTIYPNHDAVVGNELGVVSNAVWQGSYQTESGLIIPAGFNGKFKIDQKLHPNIARNIMSDPPAIHSNSVTVQFEWEASHHPQDMETFWSKLGTYGADGELIRRIATNIVQYHETSLVAHGADPYAQRVGKDGKIVNPQYANDKYASLAEERKDQKTFYFSYRNDLATLSEEPTTLDELNNNKDHNNNANKMEKEFILTLAMLVGLQAADFESLNQDDLKTKIEGLKNSATELPQAKLDLQTQKDEVTRLTEELRQAKEKSTPAEVTAANAILTELRQEVLGNYQRLSGDSVKDTQVKLIEKADHITLKALNQDYVERLEEKFPATCQSCGSTEVSRASAQTEEDETDKTHKAGTKKLTDAQTLERMGNSKVNTSHLHVPSNN